MKFRYTIWPRAGKRYSVVWTGAKGDGTAAHIMPESAKATEEDREGSVGGCLPTTTLRNREVDDKISGDDQDLRGDRPKAFNDESSNTERVDQEGSEEVATDTRDAVSVATASASGGDDESCSATIWKKSQGLGAMGARIETDLTLRTSDTPDDKELYAWRSLEFDESMADGTALLMYDASLTSVDRRAEIIACERIRRPDSKKSMGGYSWLSKNPLSGVCRRFSVSVSCWQKASVQGRCSFVSDPSGEDSGSLLVDDAPVCEMSYKKISCVPLDFADIANAEAACTEVEVCDAMAKMSDPRNNGRTFLLESQSNAVTYRSSKDIITNSNFYGFNNTRGAQEAFALHPAVGQFLLDQAASDTNQQGLESFADIVGTQLAWGLGLHVRNGTLVLPISEEHGERWDSYLSDALVPMCIRCDSFLYLRSQSPG